MDTWQAGRPALVTWLALLRAIPLVIRVAHRLSRSKDRRYLARKVIKALGDGEISTPEWVSVGHTLGVFHPRRF